MYGHHFFFPPAFGPEMLFGNLFIGFFFLVVAAWVLVWKGLALWHAARNGQKIWFLVLLILNTLGILEIIYLVWFRTKDPYTPSLFSTKPAAPVSSTEKPAE